LSTADAEPTQWQPVTAPFVLVLEAPSGWEVEEVAWTVGTADPLAFYQQGAGAGFDDEDEDGDSDSYHASCTRVIRGLLGDALPQSFSPSAIAPLMPTPIAQITGIAYHYAQADSAWPSAITATNAVGESRYLRLIG